ncbi:4a-hydroxytetrahydrobiopterin dehydratase [Brachybacterium hainanense]|uniref:Putative pterin-4-alpha-carbinolamine dehydratase n=1 Tax=Brachybacterium hainanense TaxID=1541174 RepID=A0ABV6REI7_9MICO
MDETTGRGRSENRDGGADSGGHEGDVGALTPDGEGRTLPADLAALSDEEAIPAGALRELLDAYGAGEWRIDEDGLCARYATGDFRAGLALVDRIGEIAEAAAHHPDVLLTYPTVEVRTVSHDVRAVTRRDVRLAAGISAAAAEGGVGPDGGDPRRGAPDGGDEV